MLQTKRLILDEVRGSDVETLNAIRNDPEVRIHLPTRAPESLDTTAGLIERMNEANRRQEGLNFAIRLLDARLIGFIGLWAIHPAERWGEIGFLIGKDYWNQGYAKEALGASLPVFQARGDCDEIRAVVHQDNVYSLRLLARFGFTQISISGEMPGFEIHRLATTAPAPERTGSVAP
ncbi:GNAT family N-acetyltransferase [Haliangium sp.]|uniref:GNAT family N-acetyltransferase n=1 Tax=Haliangium sp. TaxID=2663208 RepID=UPI003D09E334